MLSVFPTRLGKDPKDWCDMVNNGVIVISGTITTLSNQNVSINEDKTITRSI